MNVAPVQYNYFLSGHIHSINKIYQSKGTKPGNLTIEKITRNIIVDFLKCLQEDRNCCHATRNVRLAAIHSFYKYLQYQLPENLHDYQQILTIPTKKSGHKAMSYLSIEGITLLLKQPDTTRVKGRRDLALLSLLYDTGSRVQEIIDLNPSCIRLDKPATIRVTGKGGKTELSQCLKPRYRCCVTICMNIDYLIRDQICIRYFLTAEEKNLPGQA